MLAFRGPQGGSKSLWLGFIKTGAGFRVNFRRISKGGYPQNGEWLMIQTVYQR